MEWLFFAIAPPFVAILVLYWLWLMPSRDTGWFVKVVVGISWFAALSILIIVPIDVSSALARKETAGVKDLWNATYWYTIVAQISFLPLLMGIVDSGHFKFVDRLKESIWTNLVFYVTCGVLGFAGLLLLLASGQLEMKNVVGFCIGVSNAAGLTICIFLIGYGLVEIPRQLWRASDVKFRLRNLAYRAGEHAEKALKAHRTLSEANSNLQDSIKQFYNKPELEYMEQIEAMIRAVPGFRPEPIAHQRQEYDEVFDDINDLQDLGRLRRVVRIKAGEWDRERSVFLRIVQDYQEMLCLDENMARPWGPYQRLPGKSAFGLVAGHAVWLWRCRAQGVALKVVAVLLVGLAATLLLAECTLWARPKVPNLSAVSLLLHQIRDQELLLQLVAFAMLLYPCACAYYALAKLGQFSFYLLVPHHTTPYCLIVNTLLMCRVTAPLAFNFMAAVALPESHGSKQPSIVDTAFYEVAGELMMKQPPPIPQYTNFAPLILLPYSLLVFSHLLNRALSTLCCCCKLASGDWAFQDDTDDPHGYVSKGGRLLRRELENAEQGMEAGLTINPLSEHSDGYSSLSRMQDLTWSGGRSGADLVEEEALGSQQRGSRSPLPSLHKALGLSPGTARQTGASSSEVLPLVGPGSGHSSSAGGSGPSSYREMAGQSASRWLGSPATDSADASATGGLDVAPSPRPWWSLRKTGRATGARR